MKKIAICIWVVLALTLCIMEVQAGTTTSATANWQQTAVWSNGQAVNWSTDVNNVIVSWGTTSTSFPNATTCGKTGPCTISGLPLNIPLYFIASAVSTTTSIGGGSIGTTSTAVTWQSPVFTIGPLQSLTITGTGIFVTTP